jgi:nicotinamide-nucleotide amidase
VHGRGVGALITGVAGASAAYLGGVVAYHNTVKVQVLGVKEEDIAEHGAVSEPVARAMAEGARRVLGVDLAVAVTGVAGPSGGTAEKPVGTVDVAVADAGGTSYKRLKLFGERALIQHAAAMWALKLVWDRLVEVGLAEVGVQD